MTSLTLESFVNSIRNLYQKPSSLSPSAQNNQQQTSSTASSHNHEINYTEVQNTIHSHLNVFYENATNLLDNVLPIFTLPEYTLPNMAVLYAIITQLENSSSASPSAPTTSSASNSNTSQKSVAVHSDGAPNPNQAISSSINHEKLLNEVESCIQFSDERQVHRLEFF